MTDDLLQELSQIQQYAAGLQGLLDSAQAQAPMTSEGTDGSGAVRVLLDADGLPNSVRVEPGWHRKLAAEAFGDAVVEASQAAMGVRLATWTSAYRGTRAFEQSGTCCRLLKGLPTVAPPSKSQIKVATDSLRAEAAIWDQQSSKAAQIAGQTGSLRTDRLEAGVFQIIVSAYGAVVDQVTARSTEGQRRMADIANTLHQVANTYDQEEAENLHLLRNLY